MRFIILPVIIFYYYMFNRQLWFEFSNIMKFDFKLDDLLGTHVSHYLLMVMFLFVWPIYMFLYTISADLTKIPKSFKHIMKCMGYHNPNEAKNIHKIYELVHNNIDNIINHG